MPARVVLFLGLLFVVLLLTGTFSTRSWWAHRVHDLTGGSRTADYLIGFAVALLPLVGVALGAVRTRRTQRVIRMLLLGAVGFVITYLLAPSPARYLTDDGASRVFDQLAPGYLAGVFTGALLWLAALVVAVIRVRMRWRRFTRRFGEPRPPDASSPRVIDI